MQSNFAAIDLAVLLAYLAGTTALGIWVGRRQRDARDYFVADRAIPWAAVMFSVVASETSALTFISIPGLAWATDLGFLQVAAGYILGRIVVANVLLPRYYQGELVTAYSLLEKRFGLTTRRFTSVVFMVTRAMADAVRVFATAIPIALILGSSIRRELVMPVAILILGLLTVVYTYRGGMKAVVWTEIVQATVYLLGGISAIILIGKAVPGGWSSIIDTASAAGKLRVIDTTFALSKTHTIWSGLIGGAFLSMASHGADQLIVQRLLSSRSLRDAQRAIIGSGIVVFVQFALFLMIGVGLWALFQGRAFTAPDAVFPTFIVERMPHGLLGLIVAAIVAATMSTHSGAINSLAASSLHDLYLPITKHAPDSPQALKMGKLFALGWGVVLTGAALLFKEQGTPAVIVALGIASFTYGALLGGFFLGIFVKRARQRDAIIGMSVAIVSMALIVFSKQIIAAYPGAEGALGRFRGIAVYWYVLIGTVITMLVGTLSSFVGQPSPAPAERAR
ncbi:MAG TPA: sodium:solute symporter [Gemmatimonadaceae bacterium]|nr:sodium:solute symporter [Gemmatimonadaceae bacterium]